MIVHERPVKSEGLSNQNMAVMNATLRRMDRLLMTRAYRPIVGRHLNDRSVPHYPRS
jgi:hypothetical protein